MQKVLNLEIFRSLPTVRDDVTTYSRTARAAEALLQDRMSGPVSRALLAIDKAAARDWRPPGQSRRPTLLHLGRSVAGAGAGAGGAGQVTS